MEKNKLYFENVDSTICYDLDYFIHNAEQGDEEITILEAIPDKNNPDYIFCGWAGEVGERSQCSKKLCNQYSSKSGRGKCLHKGYIYEHGEQVTFKVDLTNPKG